MAKCSFCNRRAIFYSRVNGKFFCEKHFLKYFDRKVRRTIRKYHMFGKNETIVVAVSGGKDSLSLLHYLSKLSKRAPGWIIKGLLIDEGIAGYREHLIGKFIKTCNELDVEYKIVSFKEEFGYSLDEIVKKGKQLGLPYLPCTYCGVFRRYLLNKESREMGGTVLATAHNLDDVIQTFLMNILNNNWDRVARIGPVSGVITHVRFVRRVKPFFDILEKETTTYSILHSLYPDKNVECPYAPLSFRWYIRKFLNDLEMRNPGIKYSLLNSLVEVLSLLREKYRESDLKTCKICGEPSSQEVCRACMLRRELGIL
ncbi:MAG: TIGR00269 family protein [Thermoproteales archaeon]|nr:TIGR00269 family protein [Thermoproteales archaeon]